MKISAIGAFLCSHFPFLALPLNLGNFSREITGCVQNSRYLEDRIGRKWSAKPLANAPNQFADVIGSPWPISADLQRKLANVTGGQHPTAIQPAVTKTLTKQRVKHALRTSPLTKNPTRVKSTLNSFRKSL